MPIDPSILTRPLQGIDTSPLWQAAALREERGMRQQQQERQSRLDQLAFEQFEETIAQNQRVNARADTNAETNRTIAENNTARLKMEQEENKESVRKLRAQADAAEMAMQTSYFNRVAALIGSYEEVILESLNSDQPVPEETIPAIEEVLTAAEADIENPQLSNLISVMRPAFESAKTSGSVEDWMGFGVTVDNALKFTAPPQEQMSSLDQAREEQIRASTRNTELQIEEREDTQTREEETRQADGDRVVTLARGLLEDDDLLEASSGRYSKFLGNPLKSDDKEWRDNFDLLKKNLTLEKLQAFTGAKSDAERIYAEFSTGLDLNLTDDQMRQRLRGLVAEFEGRGFKDTGLYRIGSSSGQMSNDDIISTLSPESQELFRND